MGYDLQWDEPFWIILGSLLCRGWGSYTSGNTPACSTVDGGGLGIHHSGRKNMSGTYISGYGWLCNSIQICQTLQKIIPLIPSWQLQPLKDLVNSLHPDCVGILQPELGATGWPFPSHSAHPRGRPGKPMMLQGQLAPGAVHAAAVGKKSQPRLADV